MAYTPQLSNREAAILRRIAWAMRKPMTKALSAVINLAAGCSDKESICDACKDDSFCTWCPFKKNDPLSLPDYTAGDPKNNQAGTDVALAVPEQPEVTESLATVPAGKSLITINPDPVVREVNPVDIIELRKEPHLSASAVQDYLTCGFLYKLRRIEKLRPEFTSEALIFGSTVHAVLAEFNHEKMAGKKMALKNLLSLFGSRWEKAAKGNGQIQYSEGKGFSTLLEEGQALLSACYPNLAQDGFRVLASEHPFRFVVNGIPVIGVIDLIEEDESGTIIVTDFKTSSRAYSADDVDKNMQLTIYHMGVKANGYADREVLLRIDGLIKTKTPKFQQLYTSRSDLDHRRVSKKMSMVWDGIRKGVFIPNDGNWKCRGCEFKSYCDRFLESEEAA